MKISFLLCAQRLRAEAERLEALQFRRLSLARARTPRDRRRLPPKRLLTGGVRPLRLTDRALAEVARAVLLRARRLLTLQLEVMVLPGVVFSASRYLLRSF